MEWRDASRRGRLRPFTLWLVIWMPLVLLGLAFAGLTRAQQGVLRDWLLSWLVLCPLILCTFPLYLLLLALSQAALPKAGFLRLLSSLRRRGRSWQGRLREWQQQLPDTALVDEHQPAQKRLDTENGDDRAR